MMDSQEKALEQGMTEEIFTCPKEDYTKRLIAAIPQVPKTEV